MSGGWERSLASFGSGVSECVRRLDVGSSRQLQWSAGKSEKARKFVSVGNRIKSPELCFVLSLRK